MDMLPILLHKVLDMKIGLVPDGAHIGTIAPPNLETLLIIDPRIGCRRCRRKVVTAIVGEVLNCRRVERIVCLWHKTHLLIGLTNRRLLGVMLVNSLWSTLGKGPPQSLGILYQKNCVALQDDKTRILIPALEGGLLKLDPVSLRHLGTRLGETYDLGHRDRERSRGDDSSRHLACTETEFYLHSIEGAFQME